MVLLYIERKGITKVITVNPEGNMNVCPTFHGNP